MHTTYLIIGAGPTGLSAARRLAELGENDFLILERTRAGGPASGLKDAAGFTWDVTPPVFPHRNKAVDKLLDDLFGSDLVEHERDAWIRAGGAWVPYPFQGNLQYLPPSARLECVLGLLEADRNAPEAPSPHLAQWFIDMFGTGIADMFLTPHNEKFWGLPPTDLATGWAEERIQPARLEDVLETIIMERDDVGHGPHATFRTPYYGGMGEVFKRLAKPLGDRILIGQEVTGVDQLEKRIQVKNADPLGYTHLLVTTPLDKLLLHWLTAPPDPVLRAARELRHTSSHLTGVGVPGARGGGSHWMYFPQANCPFHRVVNNHNLSPKYLPPRGEFRALTAETSWCGEPPAATQEILENALEGLVNATLISQSERREPTSLWSTVLEYAAPVPDHARDAALSTVQTYLEATGIAARGRFGGWKIETGDLDQCMAQGMEWAERMLLGTPEQTYSF